MIQLDPFRLAKGFLEWDVYDVRGLERNHVRPLFLRDRPHRRTAEARGEEAIVAGGLTSPLKMAEDE